MKSSPEEVPIQVQHRPCGTDAPPAQNQLVCRRIADIWPRRCGRSKVLIVSQSSADMLETTWTYDVHISNLAIPELERLPVLPEPQVVLAVYGDQVPLTAFLVTAKNSSDTTIEIGAYHVPFGGRCERLFLAELHGDGDLKLYDEEPGLSDAEKTLLSACCDAAVTAVVAVSI